MSHTAPEYTPPDGFIGEFMSFAKLSHGAISQLLQRSLEQNMPIYQNFGTLAEQSYRMITEFTTNGKMLRGTLVHMAYNGYIDNERHESDTDVIIYAACALELLQSFLLIHDDIMDNSTLRRNKPTVHKQFSDYCYDVLSLPNHQHKGVSLAICAGDVCFALSSHALNTALSLNRQSQQHHDAVRNLFYREIVRVGMAQMDDIVLSNPQHNPSSQTILNLYEQKTGYYSIVLPLTIGAYLASATHDIETLERIGKKIGVIFQIKDDLIDITDSAITGKQAAIDIANNKYTYPRQLLLEHGGQDVVQQLKELELSKDDGVQKMKSFRSLCNQYGVLDYIDSFISTTARSVEHDINTLVVPNAVFKDRLYGFVQYCLQRTA